MSSVYETAALQIPSPEDHDTKKIAHDRIKAKIDNEQKNIQHIRTATSISAGVTIFFITLVFVLLYLYIRSNNQGTLYLVAAIVFSIIALIAVFLYRRHIS